MASARDQNFRVSPDGAKQFAYTTETGMRITFPLEEFERLQTIGFEPGELESVRLPEFFAVDAKTKNASRRKLGQ